MARSLKLAWPDCRITWLVSEVSAGMLKNNPYLDELLIWSRERFEQHLSRFEWGKARQSWAELRAMLSGRTFSAVLDIHGLFLTGLIARLPKTSRRIGLSGAREFNSRFMTETAAPLSKHITGRYLGVLAPLGLADAADPAMTLVVPPAAAESAGNLLWTHGVFPGDRFAVLVPGTTWPTKNWPTRLFGQTARLLAADYKIVLCGSKAEMALGQAIEQVAWAPVVNLVGHTGLLELAGILQRSAAVVSGDTGPLHIAAALAVPTVSIFGPTDPAVFAPLGPRNAVLYQKLSCSFCHKTKCPKGTNACMVSIPAEAVADSVYKVTAPSDRPTRHRLGRLPLRPPDLPKDLRQS